MKKIKVLLVENDENDAYQIAGIIDEIPNLSIEIFHLSTLAESNTFLKKQKVDIILINLFLPDSYGIHTFDNLFNQYSDIPFLILTDLNDHEIGINAVKKGAQDFLLKNNLNHSYLSKSIVYAIERKKSEKQLRKSEEKYRELFIRSKDAIYITTLEGEFVDINPTGLAMFDYTMEDLENLKVEDLYADVTDRHILSNTLREQGQVIDYELVLKKKNPAEKIICLLNATLVYNNAGKIIGFQGILRNITEQKTAENALMESLEKLDNANKKLLDLNTTLEQKVEERTKQLQKEKHQAEIQNKEINESIQYAKRIQASILPPINRLKGGLSDFFIYYEPKDVVSGDFYWYENKNNNPLFAVVDCTGHGVPGAFMSIIGYTQLNEIVNQQDISDPGLILQELDKRVRVALQQNKLGGKNSKDGMELAIININYTQQYLEYAGAMRPLYYVRNEELQIIKGDKFSIGGVSLREKKFTTKRINFQKEDSYYLFSDGYPDQFGGPKRKKFMTRNVGNMLRGIAHLSMTEQKKIIKTTIQKWSENEEQVDDILFAGIKF